MANCSRVEADATVVDRIDDPAQIFGLLGCRQRAQRVDLVEAAALEKLVEARDDLGFAAAERGAQLGVGTGYAVWAAVCGPEALRVWAPARQHARVLDRRRRA